VHTTIAAIEGGSNFLAPNFSLLLLLFIVAGGLVLTALWVWSLVDALRIRDRVWDAAGQNKVLWVLLIVLLGLLGSVLYLFIPKPELRKASAG
jgi:hypothetical protein